ncbi:MAG: FAD-dependent oxidoreductase [Pseudomonadales bacterium]
MTTPLAPAQPVEVDAAIVGGGIAGIWLLNLLQAKGYRAVLFEGRTLGGSQTLASQGMIHGGLKYALGGKLTGASEAIGRMPAQWRECLAGTGSVNLAGLQPLSEDYFMFAADSTLGRLTGFFASKTLRGRIEKVDRADYPAALKPLDGVVYRLNDFVLDTTALLGRLLAPVKHLTYQHEVKPEHLRPDGSGWGIVTPAGMVRARRLILCAGTGSGPLLGALDTEPPRLQTRPLHQVLVRHRALQPLYAHCLTGIRRPEPRLTITSHREPHGDAWLWYLGGSLATEGVSLGENALIDHARAELRTCVPWLDWSKATFDTLRIDRAEPYQTQGTRPDEAFAWSSGASIVCWPTKLSLAPDLGERVLSLLDPPAAPALPPTELHLPAARLGQPPWCPSG